MNIIEKVIKRLSYEARVKSFIKDSENMVNYYTSLMPNNVIGKEEILRTLHSIEVDLVFLTEYKKEYKNTKNENYKRFIRKLVREISKKERKVRNLIGQNRNFFIHIYSLQTVKTK